MRTEGIIYIDHAAATPLDSRVLRVMQPFFADNFYNPSSPYAPAAEVRQHFEEAKHQIAIEIGAQRDDCIMTAGATESINLALSAAAGGHVVVSSIEHPAVLAATAQYSHAVVDVRSDGIIDPPSVADAIQPDTQVVSIGLANSELGTIQPLREIATVVQSERARRHETGDKRPIWLHSDASQAAGQLDVNVARLGVDLLTINAGKIYGPKQVGLLWRRAGVQLSPIVRGGSQEMGLRSGTENVPGVIGFAEAMRLANKQRATESRRLSDLRNSMQKQLLSAFGADVVFFGNQKRRLSSHLSVSFPGIDAERLVFMLESHGVLVATGSACAANKGTGSHVLRAIGASEREVRGSLRITFGKLNNSENTRVAAERLIEVVNLEKARIAI